MAFKIVAAFALLAVVVAVPVEYHQQPAYQQYVSQPIVAKAVAIPVHKEVQYEHEAPAAYEFSYSVHDEHTGDIKEQQETRKGDQVHGSYSLIDSDGHKRIVEYTADHHNGFNAVVHREPTDIKIPVPVQHHDVHQVKYVAPVAKIAVAPVAHYAAAPVAHYAAAPVAHSSGHESAHVTFNDGASNYHY